jgi:hypothetical protein
MKMKVSWARGAVHTGEFPYEKAHSPIAGRRVVHLARSAALVMYVDALEL